MEAFGRRLERFHRLQQFVGILDVLSGAFYVGVGTAFPSYIGRFKDAANGVMGVGGFDSSVGFLTLNVPATARASVYVYNDVPDVEALVVADMALGETIPVTPFLALHHARNEGVAFSMLAGFGDTGDVLLVLATPLDEVGDRDERQIVLVGEDP